VRDLRLEGVDREDGPAAAEPLDDGNDPLDLLLDRHGRAGSELRAADVDEVGAVGGGPAPRGYRGAEAERPAPVEERVGRAVHDRHDRDLAREVEGAAPDGASRLGQRRQGSRHLGKRHGGGHQTPAATSDRRGIAGSASRAGSTATRDRISS
jgi:hypothetical protein